MKKSKIRKLKRIISIAGIISILISTFVFYSNCGSKGGGGNSDKGDDGGGGGRRTDGGKKSVDELTKIISGKKFILKSISSKDKNTTIHIDSDHNYAITIEQDRNIYKLQKEYDGNGYLEVKDSNDSIITNFRINGLSPDETRRCNVDVQLAFSENQLLIYDVITPCDENDVDMEKLWKIVEVNSERRLCILNNLDDKCEDPLDYYLIESIQNNNSEITVKNYLDADIELPEPIYRFQTYKIVN